jgi:SIR2-like domain
MPGRPAWRATPRGLRSLAEAADALQAVRVSRSKLAVIVGAGVDQSIADRPAWTDLLGRLGNGLEVAGPCNESLTKVARDWPMETAEALRLTLGPDRFGTVLREALPPTGADEVERSPLARAIAKLVEQGASIIVSLNYTDDLVTALRARLQRSFVVRVIDRSEMSAWPLGHLLTPELGEVHVLKLHGSLPLADTAVESDVVLDRSSYDAAVAADSPYGSVLSRLFEDFAVLSVGVSWTDVPLRDAAARARRQLPVARTMHYAAWQHSGDGARDWWQERALTASYGLRPLYYVDHGQVADLLSSIVELVDSAEGPSPDAPLSDIADWLDRAGDYESRQQSTWFAAHWRAASEAVKRACDPATLTSETWLAAARVERHLRHFLWFWLAPREKATIRRQLWQGLADAWSILPSSEAALLWQDERIALALDWNTEATCGSPDRALLDFALGVYEVHGRDLSIHPSAAEWIDRLDCVCRHAPHSITRRRIATASKVWTRDASLDLVNAARDACWEGMEAKLALDIAENRLRSLAASLRYETPRDWPGRDRDALWLQSDHVRELSRVAGSNRREAGAVVLASFLAPIDRAEGDLIASYRRLRDLSGGQIEPTSAWAVIIGLIAVFADQARTVSDHELVSPLCTWLADKCGQIPISTALASVVEQNYTRHWQQFHRRAANLAPRVAGQLLREAGGNGGPQGRGGDRSR